jgi:hypothetical protein
MTHKLGICIPYRDRKEHLERLIPHLSKHLNEKGIEHSFYVAHQVDDKLFNRGTMKNIAAKHAFDDGCDYIAWHDVDMIPNEECDYSYPKDNPIHIATELSKYNYGMSYPEYFGGVILFTKEQVEKTNGYSNEYWDWGMEDDDLFWRCVQEGYAEGTTLGNKYESNVAYFNGLDSKITFRPNREQRNAISNSHTISVLVKADQQIEKVPIWLIGDSNRQFVEYPIFRKPGYDWGLSFNNSRAYTAMLWDRNKTHLYQWIKRYENQWSWITLSVNTDKKFIHFYLNGEESDSKLGTGTDSPLQYTEPLKKYGMELFQVGYSDGNGETYFKGYISQIKMWDRCLSKTEIKNIHKETSNENLILDLEFSKDLDNVEMQNVKIIADSIIIPNTILPYRKNGRFECLPHEDEGLINVDGIDKWAKGETTAKNEERYILQMQQGKIDYKSDGINSINYELVSIDTINNQHKMINVKI